MSPGTPPALAELTAGTDPAATPAAAAELLLARLENAEDALLAPSGVAAATLALAGLTNPGGHLVVSEQVAGPLRDWLDDEFQRTGRALTYTDCTDPAAVESVLRPETQLVYAQTLTDPGMRLCPVNDLAALAHTEDLLLAVDNTGLSPAAHRPLDAGAAVVVEDCEPYLDGHGGLWAGVVAGSARLLRRIRAQARVYGATADAESGGRLQRALLTLRLRMAAQQRAADTVAERLRDHKGVAAVHRPGFAQYPWARETHEGFGGLLAFETAETGPRADELVALLRAAGAAGDGRRGLETLVSAPALTSHAHWSERQRQAVGVTRRLVRVAVGIDDPEPLLRVLLRLLDQALPARDGQAAQDGQAEQAQKEVGRA